jgi:hypothetical protein
MKNSRTIWQKVRKDLALNLSELAIASGYDRGTLTKMRLPLQAGKMSLSDFKRVLRGRQNLQERHSREMSLFILPSPPSESAVVDRSTHQVADKFDAPSSRRARRAASPSPLECPLGNTG